jgi:hypothetical protein
MPPNRRGDPMTIQEQSQGWGGVDGRRALLGHRACRLANLPDDIHPRAGHHPDGLGMVVAASEGPPCPVRGPRPARVEGAAPRAPSTPSLGHPSAGRAWQLAAQHHLQGAAPGHCVPVADRQHKRRRTRSVAPRTRPDNLINWLAGNGSVLGRPGPGGASGWFCGLRRPRGVERAVRCPWSTMHGRAVSASQAAG